MPRRRAREQQVGDVRADDEQDQRHDRAENRHRPHFVVTDVIHAAVAGIDPKHRHIGTIAVS